MADRHVCAYLKSGHMGLDNPLGYADWRNADDVGKVGTSRISIVTHRVALISEDILEDPMRDELSADLFLSLDAARKHSPGFPSCENGPWTAGVQGTVISATESLNLQIFSGCDGNTDKLTSSTARTPCGAGTHHHCCPVASKRTSK